MPIHCPTCSRANPASAAYCFYDGRALSEAGPQGPVGLGARPFSLLFSFSDGHGCANYNQLVLACDRHWNEARANLYNGTWQSFFSTIGRADLAALALHSARETDPDVGLCRLLEGLPADAEALRPPKLALTAPAEDLGTLEPGKDHKFQLVIENQGSLLLRGSAMTDCDWLSFGDRQRNAATKLFQTRDSYTLSVWVAGNRLRAGKKPLEGHIVIDTNGGCLAVPVRATVPVRPFPTGPDPSNVLAGATSPRELAVKARAHPREAAVLFAQGTVKAWYESNGWTYPIQGTQARGMGALQQFFEALGLTKAPRLTIDLERIDCRGEVGERLGKDVVVRTDESRPVHAEGHGNEPWIEVRRARSQGNSVTIPVRIDVPPRPGETLQGAVTILGNGQQRFVIPVTLTIAGVPPAQPEEKPSRGRRPWALAGVGLGVLLVVGGALALILPQFGSDQEPPPPPTPPRPPVQAVKAWWDGIPGNHFAAPAAKLKDAAGEHRPIFDRLEAESNDVRRQGYEQLAAKLPQLARNLALRVPLGQFVTECCVHEPSEFNLSPLLRGLADQFPVEDRAFPTGDRGEGAEHAAFWLGVVCDAIAHKAARPERSRILASELRRTLGVDPDTPLSELRDRAEKSLAELCYHNTLPTAEKSVEQALAIRDLLIARFPRHLPPDFRGPDDVKLLALGLSGDSNLWPKLKPLFESCVQCNEIDVGFKLIDLYEKADAELAPKMEEVLAVRWKVAANARLAHAARAAAIRNALAVGARAARISHADRVKQWQMLLANKSWSGGGKTGGQQQIASLQEIVRLAHASTMASLLFSKDAEAGRFDELVARIPLIEQGKPDEEKKPQDSPRPRPPGAAEVIDVAAGKQVSVRGEFTDQSDSDPRRGAYRKVYLVPMKAREIYHIYMRSTALTPYLRLETAAGQQMSGDKGPSAHITYVPQGDGDYRLVSSSVQKEAVGNFTLQVTRQQQLHGFGGFPFGQPFPRQEPGQMPEPMAGEGDRKTPVNLNSDLALLRDRQGEVRVRALRNLAGSVPDNLAYHDAQRLAAYLLQTEWADNEQNAVTESLPSLAQCPLLLQAVADVIAGGGKLAGPRTLAVVGGLLGRPPLRFDTDEDWRLACRKLLLQRALELTKRTAPAAGDADRAADLLRDLYKEQGLALGLDAPDFEEQSQLALVLARLIKHLAARAALQELAPADEAWLRQVDRQLQAAQFVAGNDLEHVVLLQRIWIKVLALALEGQATEPNRKLLREVPQELEKKDRQSGNLLDQLRFGEEKILQVWALARDLKSK